MIKIVATQEDFAAHIKELEAEKKALENCAHPKRRICLKDKEVKDTSIVPPAAGIIIKIVSGQKRNGLNGLTK